MVGNIGRYAKMGKLIANYLFKCLTVICFFDIIYKKKKKKDIQGLEQKKVINWEQKKSVLLWKGKNFLIGKDWEQRGEKRGILA